MFFYASKVVGFFLNPSTFLIFILLIGVAMLWSRWARAGRRVVLGTSALLMATGFSPLGHALLLPLEQRFTRTVMGDSNMPAGVIILGGAQDMSVTARRGTPAINEAGERLIEAARLARTFPQAKILFSGGSDAVFGDRISEASGAKALLESLGVAPDRILLESKSRNTYQNAAFSKALVKPNDGGQWLLVTSAGHMPRAVGVFRKVGFDVEPWPVDYRTRGHEDLRRFFPKASEGWRRVDAAVREWIGLVAYWLTRRTDALFPAP